MTTRRSDIDLNVAIARILRYGALVSGVVLVAGLFLVILAPQQGTPGTLQGVVAANFGRPTLSASALAVGLEQGNPVAVLQVGLLLLIATPLVRVAASVVLFLGERDLLYVGVTSLVLAMLLFAIFVIGPFEA